MIHAGSCYYLLFRFPCLLFEDLIVSFQFFKCDRIEVVDIHSCIQEIGVALDKRPVVCIVGTVVDVAEDAV